MTRARKRTSASLLILGLLAAMYSWGAPVAEAATCQNVPGSTPPFYVAVGGRPVEVPGVSGISVCSESGTYPLVTATTDGRGSCAWGCFSVVIPAGNARIGSVTVNYSLNGEPTSRTVGGVETPTGTEEMCLISVGAPQAPYPLCEDGVAFGVGAGDPTTGTLEDVQEGVEGAEETAEGGVGTVTAVVSGISDTVVGLVSGISDDVDSAVQTAEDEVAELQRDLEAAVANADEAACDAIPAMMDYYSGNYYEFCDGPSLWLSAAKSVACWNVPDAYDPRRGYYVAFCDEPAAWVDATIYPVLAMTDDADDVCLDCRIYIWDLL